MASIGFTKWRVTKCSIPAIVTFTVAISSLLQNIGKQMEAGYMASPDFLPIKTKPENISAGRFCHVG